MAIILFGCSGQQFRVQNLAKSDIDFVADAHYRETEDLLKTLTVKLYKRNPVQLKRALLKRTLPGRSPAISIDQRLQQLFGQPGPLAFDELQGRSGITALELALDKNYSGDRVFALMAGLTGMIRQTYDYKPEFFMFDELDQQKLYNSARNVEILVWRLTQRRDDRGKLLLLTNSRPGEDANLSFERLFGKLIALQDMMAVIISQKTDRVINKVTINVASLAFFPL